MSLDYGTFFVLRKLNLQMRLRSHPVGARCLFFVGPFVYFNTACVRKAKALAKLRFAMSCPGIETVTSYPPQRTLYRLSYRGR